MRIPRRRHTSNRHFYPFAMVDNFRREMDSIFDGYDSFRNNNYQNLYADKKAYHFYERDNHFLISVDIPGVQKKDISIDYAGNVLTIKAYRELADEETPDFAHSSSSFIKSFTIAAEVVEKDIRAVYEQGVLKVALPKAEKSKIKKIEVFDEDDKGFFKKLFAQDDSKRVDIDTTH